MMRLTELPRVRFGSFPTPLEPLHRLSDALGGPRLWVKRDDLTGLAFGGSKVRKLEYGLGRALAEGVDVVLIHGSVQSNHARLAAAAAARLGLRCICLLEPRVANMPESYLRGGNAYLARLLGAEVRLQPPGSDLDAAADEVASSPSR